MVGTVISTLVKKDQVKDRLKCSYCDGDGKILCGVCFGTGSVRIKDGDGEWQSVACTNCEATKEVVCINCQGSGLTVPDDFIRKLGDSEVGFSEDDYIGLFDEVKFPTVVNVDASGADPMERVRAKASAEVAAQTAAQTGPAAAEKVEPVDFTEGMG